MEQAKSRSDVLDAAAQEFVLHGYAGSSLSSIAGRIGLTKGALVRKFPTKGDLAWGIIDTLHAVIAEERVRSLEVYPDSGIRALIRFLLAIGIRTNNEPQVAAAVVLFADRTSPSYKVAQFLDDWTLSILSFLEVAKAAGEMPPETELREIAEYIFVTSMGEVVFGGRTYVPDRPTPRMRHTRITLRSSGVARADEMIDDVLASLGAGSLEYLPRREGLKRPPTA